MMRYIAVATALSITLPMGAQAALSGFYDRAEQINTILQDSDIANAARQAPIDSLDFDGVASDGTLKWELDFDNCDIDVFLQAHPPQGPGKTTYTIARFQTDSCR